MNRKYEALSNMRCDEFYMTRWGHRDIVQQTMDSAYCLDAPDDIPAGSHRRSDSGRVREIPRVVYRWLYQYS